MKWTVQDMDGNIVESGLSLEDALKKYDKSKGQFIFVPELDSRNRVKSNKISIHGKMPDECIKYFEDRGISVKKGLFGYIEFRREI